MESWLQQFFSWLPEGIVYYTLIFLVAGLEALVGIGLLMPGSTLTVFFGFLALHGKGDIGIILVAAILGAFCGDFISYWLGARFGPQLLATPLLRKRAELYHRAHLFFLLHGGKSIFFGRFIGPIRGFTPFVAGGAHMQPRRFLTWTAVSSLLWGLSYPGLGYLAGASWQSVQNWTARLALGIALALVVTVMIVWGRRKIR